jgi:choline-glycine betaine transporter
MLTLVPLAMIFAKAPLNTMKTTVIVTAIPFAIITWSRCMACSNGCGRLWRCSGTSDWRTVPPVETSSQSAS